MSKQTFRASFFGKLAAGPLCNSLKTALQPLQRIFAGLRTVPVAVAARAFLSHFQGRPLLSAANAAEPSADLLLSAANESARGNLFEVLQPDSFRIPFGDWPIDAIDARTGKKIPVVQRVDAAAANEMISALSSGFLGRKGRAPIYIGHPDVPGNEQRWPDKTSYGWIKTGTVDQDAVLFGANYGRRGKDLVDDGAFMFYSPNFGLRRTGETTAAGVPICRPVCLLSMGLVNDSNIPVPPLVAVNEDQPPNPEPAGAGGQTPKGQEMTPEQLKALLAALGLTEKDTVETATARAKSLCDENASLKAAVEAAKADSAKATETAANERKALAKGILDQAIADKRITAAQRPGWEKLFDADFTAANESFGAVKPEGSPSRQSSVCERQPSAAHPNAAAAAARFSAAVETNKASLRITMVGANEHAVHKAAWTKAQAENKADFELMSKPE